MMKKTKRLLCLVMAVGLCLGSTACFGGTQNSTGGTGNSSVGGQSSSSSVGNVQSSTSVAGNSSEATSAGGSANSSEDSSGTAVDTTTANLKIGVSKGGLKAEDWLDEMIGIFNQQYPNVTITVVESDYGKALHETYNTLACDMYFAEDFFLYDWMSSDYLLDISDIVTTGGEASIESTLASGVKEYYGQYDAQGQAHYYALPYASAFNGFVYDADMWFEQGMYISKAYDEDKSAQIGITPVKETEKVNGEYASLVSEGGNSYYKTTKGDYLSHGPDGKYGTDDDGTPATVEEFFELCDYMLTECKVTPFIYSGKNKDEYTNWLLTALAANYDGASSVNGLYEQSGNVEIVDKINGDGSYTTSTVALSATNYLEAYKSKGRYEALRFVEQMIGTTGYLPSQATNTTTTHKEAQKYFMMGRFQTKTTAKFAFLADGSWWENEAADAYKDLGKLGDKYARENRNFKLLSFPKLTEAEVGTGATYVDMVHTGAFILKKTEASKATLCKKLLQLCFSKEGNAEYTKITSLARPYEYELSAEDYASLSSFGKSVWKGIYKAENSEIVYPVADNEIMKQVGKTEALRPRLWFRTRISDKNMDYSLTQLNGKKTAAEVFDGLFDYATANIRY